jgi:iron(III) transport system ATP-binding protein
MSIAIDIEHISKRFGKTAVISDLSAHIDNGEFFTLLGPSGCGKTTLLRMIAGFYGVEDGAIRFDGQVINDIPAYKRNIGMVFQNYAIFPHMTLRQNIEYGLKLRKLPKSEIREKVDSILKVVQIGDYQDRLPENLSGGQQQRIALARAIVIHPCVLLMDEPLSNLDAKLRIEMRSAIKDIQKAVGITTVYVTHDQEEALAISDRIAVIKDGVIQQVGKPEAIYTRPKNIFVASFIGHSNLFKAVLSREGGQAHIVFSDHFRIRMENLCDKAMDGQKVIVSIRPEEFFASGNGVDARVKSRTFLGKYINYVIDPAGISFDAAASIEFSQDIGSCRRLYEPGETICLGINADKINVFTENGEENLIKESAV